MFKQKTISFMIIYNVTIQVSWPVHNDWLKWMKEQHIPEVMETGLFTGYRIVKLLETDETTGPTYAVQYHAANLADYNQYIKKFSQLLRQKVTDMWGDKLTAFRTVMEVVH
jgi:hypothetical protein